MKKILLHFLLLLNFSGFQNPKGFAQTPKIDSLKNVLKTAKEDTVKINCLNALAWEVKSNDPDKAIQYSKGALTLSEKINFKKGIADS